LAQITHDYNGVVQKPLSFFFLNQRRLLVTTVRTEEDVIFKLKERKKGVRQYTNYKKKNHISIAQHLKLLKNV